MRLFKQAVKNGTGVAATQLDASTTEGNFRVLIGAKVAAVTGLPENTGPVRVGNATTQTRPICQGDLKGQWFYARRLCDLYIKADVVGEGVWFDAYIED